MTILRSLIKNKYTTIPNSVIQNSDLSDGDYRLLMYLYSLPDGWKINQTYLGQKLGCNRNNINAKIRRIKDADYLEIVRNETESKDTDYVYILKEKGTSVDNAPVNNALVDNALVNDTLINTKVINTELNKKENIVKERNVQFKKPTVEEITAYCRVRDNNIDAERFYDYYESNGWKIGKNLMKDWKATIRNWERNQIQENTKSYNKPAPEQIEKMTGHKIGEEYILDGLRCVTMPDGKRRILGVVDETGT